jgi:hypothetical protein
MAERITHPAHRGRIQAQGDDVEESVSWAQEHPPTEREGLQMLEQLAAKLKPSEFRDREAAFAKAGAFIRRSAQRNGADAPVVKSWNTKGDMRVDIEIRLGKAFVPDPAAADR